MELLFFFFIFYKEQEVTVWQSLTLKLFFESQIIQIIFKNRHKKQCMSTSELFVIRHKLLTTSLPEFRRIIESQGMKIDRSTLQNLACQVYESQQFRKNWIEYFALFSQYDASILNVEVAKDKRLIEDLIFNGKLKEFREIIGLMVNSKAGLEKYSIVGLIKNVLERKSTNQVIPYLTQIFSIKKYLSNSGQAYDNEREENYLVKYALEKELIGAAFELLEKKIGKLGSDNQELFELAKIKVNKRQYEILYKFIELYLETTRCNPRKVNNFGQNFYERIALKQHKDKIEAIITEYEQKYPQRKEQHIRRSQNKVRSSMGLGQHPKQYSNQPLNNNSKEKLIINIQNSEDQLSIQKQASKIYQKHILEKEKYYRYQKLQNKDIKEITRVGIIKSQELRYYLEQDIEYQVNKIKEQNNRYRQCFVEVLNRIKEKLTNTLNIQLEVFGSFETSLCLLESDIDIVAVPNNPFDQVDKVTFLSEIKNILETMKDEIETVNYINTASVPIIKVICTAKFGHKKIDITKKTEEHNGLQSVKLIKEYLNIYPPLESLTFILKKFIYVSGLSAPYKGGISSYALVLMIVAYIQNEYKMYELKQNKSELLIADLLIGFLKFYGFKMNYVMKSIGLFDIHNPNSWKNYTGCLSPYTDPKNPAIDLQPKLVIIDPLNEINNVGRSTHKIKQIQMAFEIAYICLHTYKQCGKKRRCESYKRISQYKMEDIKYSDNLRPCCILKRMFVCTEKFIKQ